ncbi:hypothetical protein [Paraburkholderia bannensis]|nr:hypothetical protein [Paraburkholderia bannensis]
MGAATAAGVAAGGMAATVVAGTAAEAPGKAQEVTAAAAGTGASPERPL